MSMNKVQFQAGLSMFEFFDLYGTQEKCEAVVRQWRWPQGFVCPGCGTGEHSEFRRGKRLPDQQDDSAARMARRGWG